MKKLTGKIDPSVTLAFHRLLLAMQEGQSVFLLTSDDWHANNAMSVYSGDAEGCMIADKEYVKKVRAITRQFVEQRTWGVTFGKRAPYPQELAESRRLLRKLIAELQNESKGEA